MTLLPQPLELWGYRCAPLCLASVILMGTSHTQTFIRSTVKPRRQPLLFSLLYTKQVGNFQRPLGQKQTQGCALLNLNPLCCSEVSRSFKVQALGSSGQQPTLSLTPEGSGRKCRHFKERTAPVCCRAKQNPTTVRPASNSEGLTLGNPGPSVGKSRMVATGPWPQETYTYAPLNMLSGKEAPHGLAKQGSPSPSQTL